MESYGTSQTCAAHGKLAAMGQMVITLRKENKKEVLTYFIFNDYSFIKLLIILALLSYDIKKKKKKNCMDRSLGAARPRIFHVDAGLSLDSAVFLFFVDCTV